MADTGSGKEKLRLIDLFAGAGGLTLGFVDERFGGCFQSVFGVDNDAAAVKTHNRAFGDHGICIDIEEWLKTEPDIPECDVVVGGPPCQGFSLLNKKRSGDARRALWEPYMDVVERSRAGVFVIENVPGLYGSQEFSAIKQCADKMGFNTVAGILNTADYGVPQTRKRTIIIGWKRDRLDSPDFPPKPTHAVPGGESDLLPWITVRQAIGALPSPIGTEIRSCSAPLDLHFGRNPTSKSMERYRAVPPGGNRFDLQRNAPHITPQCWIRKKSGSTDLFGRLWWDRPSVTIRTEFFKPEKGRYLHPEQDRPITHREAARLMGFPDDFQFIGSKTEVARQIGNAVPPPLAAAIARSVFAMFYVGMERTAA